MFTYLQKYFYVFCFSTITIISFSSCQMMGEFAQKHIEQPQVKFKSFTLGSISSEGIELKPVFEVINNNSFSIPIDNLNYALSFNNKAMLDGAITNLGSLPANSSKEVPISFLLNKEVLSSFKELLLNNEQLDYQVNGKVKLLGFSIPFEKKDTFYRPKISFSNLEIGNASFKELTANIKLKIDNPNNFKLPINTLAYSVSSGSRKLIQSELSTESLKQGLNEITIPISLQPTDFFSNIFSMLRNPDLPLTFEFESPLQSFSNKQTITLTDFIN